MEAPIIECELRTFVDDGVFASLRERFARGGSASGEDEQVTYYFEGNGDPDIRIQRNSRGAKIWYKGGKMHEEARREIEIPCRGEDFERLEELFVALGYRVSIKWFRTRMTYALGEVTATLDDTRGYGKIVEFEIACPEEGREAALGKLRDLMASYGLEPSPKEEFDRRYAAYKSEWRKLLGEA